MTTETASAQADLTPARWRKSSYSNGDGGNCVEVAHCTRGTVPVRDTKQRGTGPVLHIGTAAWEAFIGRLRG